MDISWNQRNKVCYTCIVITGLVDSGFSQVLFVKNDSDILYSGQYRTFMFYVLEFYEIVGANI